jgi:hypothetical protein
MRAQPAVADDRADAIIRYLTYLPVISIFAASRIC